MLVLLVTAAARGQASPPVRIANATWTATDDLGRSLPTAEQAGRPRPERWVGLFYWQWHTGLRATPQFDVTAFLAGHPKFMDFQADPPGGPKNPTYYWARPIFDYYRSDDPWVVRRQLPLIAAAGVDFLFLDYTNSSVYDRELTTFLAVSDDLKAHGLAVPRLTFFMNYQPEGKAESMYLNWYKPGHHEDSWFRWAGKPLLMCPMPTDAKKLKHPELLGEIQRYFTWRPTWALEKADRDKHLWRFLSTPTDPPALGPDGRVEQMVVNKSMGGPIWDAVKNGGVSWTGDPRQPKHKPADYDGNWTLPDVARGRFFQAEWDHAMRIAPPILLVTGWNEWTASVWDRPGVVMLDRPTGRGQGHIVDEFNMQFDRDIEPMAPTGPGEPKGYGDDYYWQFVQNLRRYKGVEPPPTTSPRATIAVSANDAAWSAVTPVFHDTVGDVANRDWAGNPAHTHYTDASARNDLATAQVARGRRHGHVPRDHGRPAVAADGRELDDAAGRHGCGCQDRLARVRPARQPNADGPDGQRRTVRRRRHRLEVDEGGRRPAARRRAKRVSGRAAATDPARRRPAAAVRLQVDRRFAGGADRLGLLHPRRRRAGRAVQLPLRWVVNPALADRRLVRPIRHHAVVAAAGL